MEQQLQKHGWNQQLEEPQGRPIHFGNLVLLALLVLSALLILVFWGWRRLWWLLPLVGGVWLFSFVLSLWEDRWRVVTAEDRRRGAPERCPLCNHEVDITWRDQRYTIRCPICGHKQRGASLMRSEQMPEEEEKIPAVVYLLGLLVGAISAFAVVPAWLNQTLAAVFGGVFGAVGVGLRESIFRTIVSALYIAVGISIIDALFPAARPVVANLSIPAVVGGVAGMFVFNVWKALGR